VYYTAASDKQVTVLIGLDLSAAFDTVNHGILTERLQSKFGVRGTPLAWLQSYLEGRTQFVKLGRHSAPVTIHEARCRRSAGSVLGPLLFTTARWVTSSQTMVFTIYHQYANDTQLHAPRYECRQHSCGTLCSCRVYRRRQTVVRPAAQPGQVGGSSRRHCDSAVCLDSSASSLSVADVDLPVAEDMTVLGVVLDPRLTFHKHVSIVLLSLATIMLRPSVTSDIS